VKPTLLFLTLFTLARECPGQATPDTLESPEIHAGGTVTLRIRAPKAAEVTLSGDWMPAGSAEKMTRDDQGVWSVTVGPLAPQVYLYTFKVDGLSIADPVNPRIKLRARTSASLMEVPGEEVWQFRDVPHGKVEINLHKSRVLGAPRQVFVYTPPDYGRNPAARYPVLYLFHGNNDVAAGWTFTGNAHLILDNLLAEKKAVPMLIAMPWGHAVPFGAPREQQARNNALFEQYLLEEVIPLVDSNYRTAPGPANRAVAGLSMGGSQALQIGLGHLDTVGSIGVFSAGKPRDFEQRYAGLLEHPKETNQRLKLLWIGVGKQDALLENVRQLRAALSQRDIRHVGFETEGGHFYPVWRRFLAEMAPLLFRQ
jgi:enterochelin esterase-like enzyme